MCLMIPLTLMGACCSQAMLVYVCLVCAYYSILAWTKVAFSRYTCVCTRICFQFCQSHACVAYNTLSYSLMFSEQKPCFTHKQLQQAAPSSFLPVIFYTLIIVHANKLVMSLICFPTLVIFGYLIPPTVLNMRIHVGIYPGTSNVMAAHIISIARREYDEEWQYRVPGDGRTTCRQNN